MLNCLRPFRHFLVSRFSGSIRLPVTLLPALLLLLSAPVSAGPSAEVEPEGAAAKPGATVAPDGALPPALAATGWSARVRRDLEEAEYHLTWQADVPATLDPGGAWQAPNRAQGLRTYFTQTGIRVVPRAEETDTWDWRLELVAYGRGKTPRPVTPASPEPDEKRLSYTRDGIEEWYVNDRRGLEQGFTLYAPPEAMAQPGAAQHVPGARSAERTPPPMMAGAGSSTPAYLALLLTGSLHPALSADGQAIDLRRGRSGLAVLHYGHLAVRDADGRELASWMELFTDRGRDGIRLMFEDHDAVYPVTVDPLITTAAWSAEGNQGGDQCFFGPSSSNCAAGFGWSIAGAGDVNGDGYDDAIVGAPHYDNGQHDEGQVFLFLGSASGLGTFPAWTADYGAADAWLGWSVAGAGDVNADGYDDIIVGAPGVDANWHTDSGLVFVFHGSPTGPDEISECNEARGLCPCPMQADWCGLILDQDDARLGNSVGGAGDINRDGYDDVIYSAPFFDDGATEEGIAFVSLGGPDGIGWPVQNLQVNNAYGWLGRGQQSVSSAGDVNGDGFDDVVVGTPGFGQGHIGRFDVWLGSDNPDEPLEWAWKFDRSASQGNENASLGWSVSAAGRLDDDEYDDFVVGEPGLHVPPLDNAGLALVVFGKQNFAQGPRVMGLTGTQAGAALGMSVAGLGDVNQDGYDDLAVGAPWHDRGEAEEGVVFVYYGSSDGPIATPVWRVESDHLGAMFGYVVSGLGPRRHLDPNTPAPAGGDANGDGYADLLIGAPVYSGDKPNEGAAFAYHGAPDPTARDLVADLGFDPNDVISATTNLMSAVGGISPRTVWDDPNTAHPGVAAGDKPGSVLISTGLAMDGGLGNTDWGADGKMDMSTLELHLNVPPGKKTLRFTTQFISAEAPPRTAHDAIVVYYDLCGVSDPCWVGMFGESDQGRTGAASAPVSHALRVDGYAQVGLSLGALDGKGANFFETHPDHDGDYDSAMLLSRMYFSDLDLPPEETENFLQNPAPSDISLTHGTYTYGRTLLSTPGRSAPFEFRVLYNSAAPGSGVMAPGWRHSLDSAIHLARVEVEQEATTPSGPTVTVTDVLLFPTVKTVDGSTEYFELGKGACKHDTSRECDEFFVDEVCLGLETNQCTPEISSSPIYFKSRFPSTQAELKYFDYPDPTPDFWLYFTRDHRVFEYQQSTVTDLFLLDTIKDQSEYNELTIHYLPDDKIDYVVTEIGRLLLFNYDTAGRLSSVEYAVAEAGWPVVRFAYDALSGDLTSITDTNGLVTTFTYDAEHNLLTVTDDDGLTHIINDYEPFDAVAIHQKASRVAARRSAADPAGALGDWECPAGPAGVNPAMDVPFFCYGAESLVQSKRRGGKTEQDYDVKERTTERRVFLGADEVGLPCTESQPECWSTTAFQYDTQDKVTREARRLQHSLGTDLVMDSVYDPESGNLTERVVWVCADGPYAGDPCPPHGTCPSGSCGLWTTLVHDADDNLRYHAVHPPGVGSGECGDPPGAPCHVAEYTYDAVKHSLLTRTEPGLPASTYTYAIWGRLLTATDARGKVTSFTHNFYEGSLVRVEVPCEIPGAATCASDYEHDSMGRTTKKTDPRGNETTYRYDTGGRKLEETVHAASVDLTTSYIYDAHDRVTSITDPAGATASMVYTPTGRLERIHDALHPAGLGSLVTYGYDADDRNTSVTDARGKQTTFGCDAADRLTDVNAPIGSAQAEYDAAGRMVSLRSGPYHVDYRHDGLGRVAREEEGFPGVQTETRYNEHGLPAWVEGGAGRIDYTYDAAGRLIAMNAAGHFDISHTLDDSGNRTSTSDTRLGGIARSFDGLDRMVTRVGPAGQIAYEYDAAGNLSRLCYDGATCAVAVAYEYDEANRLVGVCDWNCNPGLCDAQVADLSDCTARYSYDLAGNVTAAGLPDGSTIQYEYDVTHRLTGITGPHYQAAYALDAVGRRTAVTETLPFEMVPAEEASSFGYDPNNRMQYWGELYDGAGNLSLWDRLADGAPVSTVYAGYDVLNQLTSYQEVPLGAGPDPMSETTHHYDADGLRVMTVEPGGTPANERRYVYDPTSSHPRLLEERDGDDVLIARYVYGLGLVSRVDAGDDVRVYHFDGQGSTVALTDGVTGALTDAYDYTPYGRKVAASFNTSDDNPFTYHGQVGAYDDGDGLYFMGSRHYDAGLMRFLQRDRGWAGTIEDPQSLNRYAFVRGNPLGHVDPNGEGWHIVTGAVIGAGFKMGVNLATGEPVMEGVWGAALEGALSAAFPGGGLGRRMAMGAVGGLAGEGLNQLIEGEFNPERLAIAGATGAVAGGIGGKADDAGAAVTRKVGEKRLLAKNSDTLKGSMIPPDRRDDFLASLLKNEAPGGLATLAGGATKLAVKGAGGAVSAGIRMVAMPPFTQGDGVVDPVPLPLGQTPAPPLRPPGAARDGSRSQPPRPCQ